MAWFATPTSVGVAETFLVMGTLYLALMLGGAFLFRVPPEGWRPPGAWDRLEATSGAVGLTVREAMTTRPFYLLWLVLLLNVTAGIGVLGQAAAMIQEVFAGLSASAAAMFVALLSLFNMGGRLLWASISDVIGRRATYTVFFTAGPLLFALVPVTGSSGNLMLYVACFAVIMTMYGGGFATMPPYIADLFGPAHVGAINGRVLTALSVAGVLGPVAVNYLREFQIERGIGAARAYDVTMYIMAGLLMMGLCCNLAVDRAVRRSRARRDARPDAFGRGG
jgi:MFS family permease